MIGKLRWWQWLLMAVGLVLVLVIGLFVTAWLALRSPDVQQKILASLKEPLQKAGITLEVESLSLDLFAGVNLSNLHAKIDKMPPIQADLRLARLRLGYAFWPLLHKRLDISEVLVEGLRGTVQLDLPDEPKPEEPSQGLGQLIDLIRHPPAELSGPSLVVRDNQLQIALKQGTRRVDVNLQQMDIDASAALKPAVLDLAAKIGMKMHVVLDQPGLRLESDVAMEPDLSLGVRAPEKNFDWNVELKQVDLLLSGTRVQQRAADGAAVDLAFKTLRVKPKLQAARQGPVSDNPPVQELLWPLQSEGDLQLALDGIDLLQKKADQKLALTTSLTNSLTWNVHLRSSKPGPDQDWKIAEVLTIEPLYAVQNDQVLASTKSLLLAVGSNVDQGKGVATLRLDMQPLTSSALKAPVRYNQSLTATFDIAQYSGQLLGEGSVNGEPLLNFTGNGSDQGNRFQAQFQAQVRPSPSLAALHSGLQALDQLGWPALELQINPAIQHSRPLNEITKDNWHELTITNSLTLRIRQQNPSPKNLARFKLAEIKSQLEIPAREAGKDASDVSLKLSIAADGLQHKALRKAIDLEQDLDLKASVGDRISGRLQGKTEIDHRIKLMDLDINWQDRKGEVQSESTLRIQAQPSLQNLVEAAKALDDLGGIDITSEHKITLQHGADRLQDLKGLDLNKIKGDLQLTQILAQTPVGQDKRKIIWKEPLRLDSRIQLNQGRAELLTRLTEPRITAIDQASVNNLQALIKANVHNLQKPDAGEVKLMVDADSVELLREVPESEQIHKLLRKFKVVFHGILANQDTLTIKTLFVGLHDTLLQFKGQGVFRLNNQGHFDGQLESNIGAITDAPIKGTGRFTVPIKVVLFDKTRLSIDADPRFQGFSARYADMGVRNLNGGIRIHEELQLDQGKVGFLYLDTQNPFARVDYDSLEPYVGDRPLLSMEQAQYKHIVVGPFTANFEVRQNLVLLNEMKMDLLSGSTLGRFYLDLHPERLQLGFLGRFSGIQAELLREPGRRLPQKDWAPLSGRMALNFDIRKRLATGRLDLTQIGQRQLLSLLDVLDPDYKDDQMIMARRALHVSYPQGVAISMDQGLMDMNILLGGVISKDLYIRSIPLTGLINAKAGEALQQIEKMLQSGGS